MQAGSHSNVISQSANIAGLNGRIDSTGTNGAGPQLGTADNFIFENVDPTNLDGDDDSDGDGSSVFYRGAGQEHSMAPSGVKPGKKTKGRVKIKMEFIENKLRRYTTFSKRKTGIMKKAYELSTLTGTQVMLLVASETGHVYTFATRKLQPMITSESGKALIQTCLNSPDPPPGATTHLSLEQRMNPSGFEETELTCAVGEDESKVGVELEDAEGKPVFHISPRTSLETHTSSTSLAVHSAPQSTVTLTSQPVSIATRSESLSVPSSAGNGKVSAIPLQIPGLVLQSLNQTGSGQPLTIPASQLGVTAPATQSHTVYRTPSGQLIASLANPQAPSVDSSSTVTTHSLNFLSGSSATAVAPSQIIMYQTPQGVMYATPTPSAALSSDRTIFNFQQPATAISIPQSDSGGGSQQIITIPVPVSLASTQQMLQLATASTGNLAATDMAIRPPPTKKSRK